MNTLITIGIMLLLGTFSWLMVSWPLVVFPTFIFGIVFALVYMGVSEARK